MSFADPVLVIGHRGAAGLAPENTLPGFQRAYACGVSAVELDVHVVADRLVVIHDDTLERTTNGTGLVASAPLATLRALDAGAGTGVSLLEEVVADLPPEVGLNIELKGPATGVAVARFLSSRPAVDVLVSSFDHEELYRFRRLDAATRVAPLWHRWRPGVWTVAAELDAWGINLSRRIASPRRLMEARRRELHSLVYTVNDLDEARRLVAAGASGVFTDYPDQITAERLRRDAPATRSPG
jgi:glycerophosphoryl diester phosphodiesterase